MSEREDQLLGQMKFTDPAWELSDGRRFIIRRVFHNTNDPMISELRPVVDQPRNRLYVFDSDGEGFFLHDYGSSHIDKTMATRAAEQMWGKPSQETWGNISRPLAKNYDDKMFELMAEYGTEIIEQMSQVRCLDECCQTPTSHAYDRWQISTIERGRIMARAVLSLTTGEDLITPEEHLVYKSPADLAGEAVEHDTFIRMVQLFGEPFDQSSGEINPIYTNVLSQYRDGYSK
jgi:hypothetical protein